MRVHRIWQGRDKAVWGRDLSGNYGKKNIGVKRNYKSQGKCGPRVAEDVTAK